MLDQFSEVQGIQGQQQQQQLRQQQIQSATLQNQMQQQQLKDSQLFMQSLQKSGGDWDKALDDASHNGMSGEGYMQYGHQLLEHKQQVMKLQTDQLTNQSKMYDSLDGELQGFKALAPQDQATQWPAVRQRVAQIAPQLGNVLPQNPPNSDQLNAFDAMLLGGKTSAENELKKRQVTAQESEAQTKSITAQTGLARLQAELPGGPLNRVTQDIQVGTNPQIQQGKVNVAAAEGQARANVEAAAARGSNAALAQVPPHLVGPASAAANKAGEDYAQAQSVTQRLNAMMDAAKKGNVVSYQLLPQEGALQLTTSQGVHRINMAEIQNYGGGSLWQKMEGHIGKALTGKSIPESVLNDMAEMQKIQAEGAENKYNNSLKTINQTYGSGFKPVSMEPMKSETQAPQHIAGGSAQGLKEGQTGKGSDGKPYVVKGGVWVPAQ